MSALLLALGLILGTAAPASIGAVTALQWAQVGLSLAQGIPQVIKADKQLLALVQSPEFRDWVKANGEGAIREYPGNVN